MLFAWCALLLSSFVEAASASALCCKPAEILNTRNISTAGNQLRMRAGIPPASGCRAALRKSLHQHPSAAGAVKLGPSDARMFVYPDALLDMVGDGVRRSVTGGPCILQPVSAATMHDAASVVLSDAQPTVSDGVTFGARAVGNWVANGARIGLADVPVASPTPANASAAPSNAQSPAARVHLHRPGTDVDGDELTGNVGGNVYVIKGNVTLQSDPKIDRAIAQESESEDPLTVTADELDIDKLGLDYVAKGHVRFVQGHRSGHADLATLNEESHTLDLIGNADVRDGSRRASAAKMHYNTLDKAFVGAGDVRIYEPLPTPNPQASALPAAKKRRHRLPI